MEVLAGLIRADLARSRKGSQLESLALIQLFGKDRPLGKQKKPIQILNT